MLRQRAEEELLAQRKRNQEEANALQRAKNIWMTGFVCLLCIGITLWFLVFQDMAAYRKADKLMESGAYYEAQVAFSALDGYKDAMQRSVEAYAHAIAQLRLRDQIQGWMWLASQGYPAADSSIYSIADKLEAEGSYQEAFQGFLALDTYKDSEDRFLSSYRKFVQQQPEMDFRLEGYQWLLEQRYSQETLYTIVVGLLETNGTNSAYPMFKVLGEYKDASSMVDRLASVLHKKKELAD